MNDELIIRVLSGSAHPDDANALRRWRRATAGNDRYYRGVRRVWAATTPPPSAPVPVVAIATAIVEAAQRLDAERRSAERRGGRGSTRKSARATTHGRWAALAAALVALFVGIELLGSRRVETSAPTWGSAAEPRTAVLPDGSLARVAPGGRLRQVASRGERRYELEGGAFFAVVHDARRPFVIEAGGAVVRVMGTRFEIGRTDAGVTTAVIDGLVTVAAGGSSVEVPRGALAFVPEDGPPHVEHPADVFERMRRPQDALLFQATPLRRVAEDVARRFGRPVTVEGVALGTRTITGWFGPEEFAEVVAAVCDVIDAACSISDTSASIHPR